MCVCLGDRVRVRPTSFIITTVPQLWILQQSGPQGSVTLFHSCATCRSASLFHCPRLCLQLPSSRELMYFHYQLTCKLLFGATVACFTLAYTLVRVATQMRWINLHCLLNVALTPELHPRKEIGTFKKPHFCCRCVWFSTPLSFQNDDLRKLRAMQLGKGDTSSFAVTCSWGGGAWGGSGPEHLCYWGHPLEKGASFPPPPCAGCCYATASPPCTR